MKVKMPEIFKTVLFSLLCILCLFSINVFADSVVYSTEGGTWVKANDTTWTMDKDGDGKTDVTLIKNGNEWKYLFTVADDSATYYAWEDPVPDGYEVVGTGTRSNPAVSSVTKYSHTSNISDDGTQNGNYANNMNTNEVITVPGAKKLHVSIKYGGESASWDWVCMWEGNYPSYTASGNYGSSLTGKLGGGNGTTKEYDVDGDTVTFAFKSDSSGCGNGFGYYAVITGQGDGLKITNRSKTNPAPKTGSLMLTKKVSGNVPAEQNFKFNITLSATDATLQKLLSGNRTYGDVSFTDGKGFVYLTPNGSVTLTDIPAGVSYSIEEESSEDYTVAWSGGTGSKNTCTGAITADTKSSVTCTNTLKEKPVVATGGLTVAKKVVNGNASDTFSFHTAFWGLEENTQYTYTVDSKSASFSSDASGMADVAYTLADGQNAVFTGLPVGCQYQTMEDACDYISSYSLSNTVNVVQTAGENTEVNQTLTTAKETLDKDESATVTYTNTGKQKPAADTTQIHVEKVWNDNDDATKQRPKNITVQLMQDEDMIATALLDADNNWSADFTDLDIYQEDGKTKCTYSVNEVEVPGYQSEITSKDTASGKSYTITNTAINIGDLKVSKTVTGDGADLTKAFRFTVTLTKDNKPVKGTYKLDAKAGTKTGTIVFDEHGKSSFTLKNAESIVIKDLPADTSYTVVETQVEGYTASEDGRYSGTISQGITASVNVTNTYSSDHYLSVSKIVKGNQGSKTKDFHFQLTLTGNKIPAALDYVKNGTSGSAKVVNGIAEFTLAHGEKITFNKVPANVSYKIVELDGASDGYTVKEENTSGILDSDKEAVFTNTKNVGVPTNSVTNTAAIAVVILGCITIVGLITLRRKKQ